MDGTEEKDIVERRKKERRRSIRRMQDRNGYSERREMAVVVYAGVAVVAGMAFAVGMWTGWWVWGAS